MSNLTSNRKLERLKKNVPYLLQELLTKNLISSNQSKLYKMIQKDYQMLSSYLYNNAGLQLIKMNNSYKLQTRTDSIKITNNDTPLTYQVYIYVTASLISRNIGDEFLQQEIADEVLSKYENSSEVEKVVKNVIKYLTNEKFLLLRTEINEKGEEIKVLKKLVQPVIYTGELKNNNLSNLAKITNYLLTNPTMNKLDFPLLWKDITVAEVQDYFVNFSNEDFGYKVIAHGNNVRAICINNKTAFPNFNNMKHRLLVDILPNLQKGQELEDLYKQSKHYTDSIKINELKETIEEYDLLNLKIAYRKDVSDE